MPDTYCDLHQGAGTLIMRVPALSSTPFGRRYKKPYRMCASCAALGFDERQELIRAYWQRRLWATREVEQRTGQAV